jgi:hypothetical protein
MAYRLDAIRSLGADMVDSRSSGVTDAEASARTFAPDRERRPAPRSDYVWLAGGLVFVIAAGVLLVVAWLAFRQTLPASGPLSMRRSPGVSVRELRSRNHEAAPWMALSSLPLLLAGTWLLVKRPGNRTARIAAGAGGLLFAAVLFVASSAVEGCVGIGFC